MDRRRGRALHRRDDDQYSPADRLGRRRRSDRHVDGLSQRDERRHLRPAGERLGRSPVDGRRGRRSAPPRTTRTHPDDRFGRRRGSDRHVAGLSERDGLRHLRPAGERLGGSPVDRRRGRPLHRREQPAGSHDRLGRRRGSDRHVAGLSKRDDYRHLRPAGERLGGSPVDRQRGRDSATAAGTSAQSRDRFGRRRGSDRHVAGLSQRDTTTSTPSG